MQSTAPAMKSATPVTNVLPHCNEMRHSNAQVRYQPFRFALALQVLLIFHRVQHEICAASYPQNRREASMAWPIPRIRPGNRAPGGYINHQNPVRSVIVDTDFDAVISQSVALGGWTPWIPMIFPTLVSLTWVPAPLSRWAERRNSFL